MQFVKNTKVKYKLVGILNKIFPVVLEYGMEFQFYNLYNRLFNMSPTLC